MCVYVAARPTTNGSAIGSSHLWGRERPPANEQDSIEMRVVLFSDGRYNSSGFGRWESGLGSAHRRIENISRVRAAEVTARPAQSTCEPQLTQQLPWPSGQGILTVRVDSGKVVGSIPTGCIIDPLSLIAGPLDLTTGIDRGPV